MPCAFTAFGPEGALMVMRQEPGHGSHRRGKLANDVAHIVNAEGGSCVCWSRERYRRAAKGQDEGGPVRCADDITCAIDSERHCRGTSVDVQSGIRSDRVANEVGEVPCVVDAESDGSSVICDAVHIGAGTCARSTPWAVEIGEVVYGSCLSSCREGNQQAADSQCQYRESRSFAHNGKLNHRLGRSEKVLSEQLPVKPLKTNSRQFRFFAQNFPIRHPQG